MGQILHDYYLLSVLRIVFAFTVLSIKCRLKRLKNSSGLVFTLRKLSKKYHVQCIAIMKNECKGKGERLRRKNIRITLNSNEVNKLTIFGVYPRVSCISDFMGRLLI